MARRKRQTILPSPEMDRGRRLWTSLQGLAKWTGPYYYTRVISHEEANDVDRCVQTSTNRKCGSCS
jgi:hypothetical protein